jgi:hypothetical protein
MKKCIEKKKNSYNILEMPLKNIIEENQIIDNSINIIITNLPNHKENNINIIFQSNPK